MMFSTVMPGKLLFGRKYVAKCIYEVFVNNVLDEWACRSVVVFGCFVGLAFVDLWVGDCIKISCNDCIPLFELGFCN